MSKKEKNDRLNIILDGEKFEWYDSEIETFMTYIDQGFLPSQIAKKMKVSMMSVGILVLWLREQGRI